MAVIQFGNTWWGGRFLNALNNFDYSNRLPRGKRYARNGSVLSITINQNMINARVQGRQRRPYSVSMRLKAFKKAETGRIARLITGNPYYLAQFQARILPEELHEELNRLGIRLFPSSWKEMNMQCSCPDWAVPCKHIAAVIYIIGNEIDKNPFILFNLRKFDILEMFQAAGKAEVEEIVSIDSLVEEKPNKYTYYQEKLEHIDFTTVPLLLEPTLKLLTQRPLFYLQGDFKETLALCYKKLRKQIKTYINTSEIMEDIPETIYTTAEIRIKKTKYAFKGSLKAKDAALAFDSLCFHTVTDYLRVLTIGDLNTYPPVISFLVMVHNFALMLMEKSAFIPDIISLSKNRYIIRWIPSLFNSQTSSIFQALTDAIPCNIVRYGDTPLSKREQVLFLVSFFISHYIALFRPAGETEHHEILSAFFNRGEYISDGFGKKENAGTIHLWLSRFFIHPKNCFPVIKISEEQEGKEFSVDILVKDRREILTQPKQLTEFLHSGNDEKFPLLKDLTLLSTYLPVVNSVLKTGAPARVSPESFVSIWFEALPVLKTLNIETLLPKALKQVLVPCLSLSFKKNQKSDRNIVSYLSLMNLMDFEWAIAIGDSFMTPEEFSTLTEKSSGIIKLKDRYIYLSAQEIRKIKKQLEKKPDFSPLDIFKMQLEGTYNNVPVQTDRELKDVINKLFTPEEVDIPSNLKATLRPYQTNGYKWLYHNCKIGLGSLMADDMGLGKTIQIITLLLKLKNDGCLKDKKALIVVPASLLTNWQRELNKFAPDLVSVIYHGSDRKIETGADAVITTYSLARRDKEFLHKEKWLAVIADEAQNIKNPRTTQTKMLKSIQADLKIAMTGTPVENRLMDYWSLLDFLMKDLLGSMKFFKENYAIPIEKFRNSSRLQSFRKMTAPFILRRVKTDKTIIKDLPEKLVIDRFTALTKEQTALYQGLVDSVDGMLENTEGIHRRGIILMLILRLKQICNHPALYLKEKTFTIDQSGKSGLLKDLLSNIISRNEKAIIFTQFREMGHMLEALIDKAFGFVPLFLHGGLSRKLRAELVDGFQNERKKRILILSLKAGGTGLNLTAANNVIHYDLWWNPAVENQATDRAFRIGQKRDVNVYRFITKGTFEEKINDMIEHKKTLAELTVNTGEKWITEMSDRELKELLKLER
jgi:uncharacterized Zn finger protein